VSDTNVKFPIGYGTVLIDGVTLLEEVKSTEGSSLVFDERKWAGDKGLFRMFENVKVVRLLKRQGVNDAQ